jgi:hypothetical protein
VSAAAAELERMAKRFIRIAKNATSKQLELEKKGIDSEFFVIKSCAMYEAARDCNRRAATLRAGGIRKQARR